VASDGQFAFGTFAADGDNAARALSDVRLLPPVKPRQILCAGANYHKHVREIVVATLRVEGDERPLEELRAEAERQLERRTSSETGMFAGLPSALCGARDDVVLWSPGHCHDWELELAVVIGRGGREIDESRALDHVAGYTISNDISVRDVQQRPRFPMTDFLMSKNRPTYFPTVHRAAPVRLRPATTAHHAGGQRRDDAGRVGRRHHLRRRDARRLRVADRRPRSRRHHPHRVSGGNAGHHGDRWLRPGDVMEGAITGLRTRRNACVAPAVIAPLPP
jgi:2,4-diketo-3-deoxy-L-fuconate hydrolase